MFSKEQFIQVLHDFTAVFMRRSMRDFKHFMDDSGLSSSQVNALMRIHFRGGCGISDIGSHLEITNAASSQIVDRLVNEGLLERSEGANDRRVKQLTLTSKGQMLIEEGIEARQRWMEELTTALTPEEHDAIINALTILIENARTLEPVN